MNLQEIRGKYPQYSQVPDQQLADSLREKYYPDSDRGLFYKEIGFIPSGGKTEALPEKSVGGFISNVGSDIVKRGQATEDIFTNNVPSDESVFQSASRIPQRLLQATGQGAGMLGDIAVEGMKAAYNNLIPEDVRGFIGERNKQVISGMSDVPAIREGATSLADIYHGAEKIVPEGMRNLEAVANIAGVVPLLKGAKTVGEGVAAVASETGRMLRSPEGIQQAIRTEVEKGFKRGIKPTIVGKADAAKTQKFYDNAATATTELVERYPDKIPVVKDGATEQFSQLIRQGKKDLHDASSSMATSAGEKGAQVNLTPAIADLEEIVKAKNILASERKAAQSMLDELQYYETVVSPSISEDLLAKLNAKNIAFWKSPNWNDPTEALFRERTANIIRKLTDAAVEKYEGPGWQDYRNKYGSLKAIEKGVTDRANVSARQSAKGFFDLANVFATGEFIAGLATMNPTMLIKGTAEKLAVAYTKNLNNVDRIVSDMFKNVKTLKGKPTSAPPSIGDYIGLGKDTVPVTPFPGGPDLHIGPLPASESVVMGTPPRPAYTKTPLPSGTARVAAEQEALRGINITRIQQELAGSGAADMSPWIAFLEHLKEVSPLKWTGKDLETIQTLQDTINRKRVSSGMGLKRSKTGGQ
jgi:hypothetical protein